MPKPLRSTNPEPRDIQFTHFGILDTGAQDKGPVVTSVVINVVLTLIVFILSAAAIKTATTKTAEAIPVYVPLKPPPPPLPRPKIVPPPPQPKPPVIKVEEPKVVLPKVTPVVTPKPVPAPQPKPLPAVTPAPPKLVVAAAAPKPVAVHLGAAASVPNRDPRPAAVSLGQANNPIAVSSRPATSPINLGNAGMAGMPPGSGRGPNAQSVNLGSGQPSGSLNGSASRGVQGVKLGVAGGTPGGTGNGLGSRPTQVALGQKPAPPPALGSTAVTSLPVRKLPEVIFKPTPVYTAEATQMRIEGAVQVEIHVSSSGSVTSAQVTRGLGHGLDAEAVRVARGMRFRPALDAGGNAIPWDGPIFVRFQMAG